MSPPRFGVRRIDAAAACDGRGLCIQPASVLVEERAESVRVLAIGRPADVSAHPASARADVISLPTQVLLPAMVNAHAHLDLTHIGPQPHDPEHGFVAWVDMVRARRHAAAADIADSVRQGIALSLAGGVVAVGDIAGAPLGSPNLTPYEVLAKSPLRGTSFVEFFGIGSTLDRVPERLAPVFAAATFDRPRVRLGLQPHAPNTVDLRGYEFAIREGGARGMPLCTHLAETLEEREFVERASGPQREFLERLGIWTEGVLDIVGRGHHPVVHLEPILKRAPFIVAHVNDATDEAIESLARTRATVAYCPRASAYFGAPARFGPHRYRDMRNAGINVALGTDSIINLPGDAARADRGGISTLDEARLLYERDGGAPVDLLAMATINGAIALGLEPSLFELTSGGEIAGIVAVEIGNQPRADPLAACLRSLSPPRLLLPTNV